MSISVTLPKMGESVMEGTIIKWLKKEGDQVAEDEPIVEISTDKIDTELPSPAAGILTKIVVGPDETVDVGTEIAIIEEGATASAEAEPPAEAEPEAKAEPKPKAEPEPKAEPDAKAAPEPKAAPASASKPEPRPAPVKASASAEFASPLVRKLARERGIDVATIHGSGSGGRITKDDILSAGTTGGTQHVVTSTARSMPVATSRYAIPSEDSEDVPFDRIRKAIAEHMTRSLQTAAQLTTVIEVDMTRIAMMREEAKGAFADTEGFSLTYMPFIAAAAIQALKTLPEMNAHILEDGLTARLYREVNLGIAVGRDEGLIVPVVHGADSMNLLGLARGINNVGSRARAKGQLTPDDLTGGTFTITNYGSFGGIIDTPIINQPQVGILGIGAIAKRPAVVTIDGNDAIAVRYICFLGLTYDHRWIDGHKAAQFNGTVKRILEEADFAKELGL